MQKIIFDNNVPDYLVAEFPATSYRNQFAHPFLNRERAAEVLQLN